MSKIDEINKFGQDILADVGVVDYEGEGFLSAEVDGIRIPVTIGGLRFCLPTQALIKDNQWDSRVPFSPLSEQTNQGPSPVLNAFKHYIYIRLTATIKLLASELMELACDEKRQKKLSEKASQFLRTLIGVDDKTKKTLADMLKKVSDTPENRLIGLFLKNGGKNGALRTCEVSFPILDDAYSGDSSTFFGITMPRKTKDKALLLALFEYILGDKDIRETYSKTSSDGEAPYFHALLLSFHKLASHLQNLIEIHQAACPALANAAFTLKWSDTLENFTAFADQHSVAIPPLPGNRGQERDDLQSKNKGLELSGDDVGLRAKNEEVDVPWYRDDEERERDRARRDTVSLSPSRREIERDRGRDDRPSRPVVGDDGIRRGSGRDLLSGRDRGFDRDDRDRGGSRRERDRDRGRDRDDRWRR